MILSSKVSVRLLLVDEEERAEHRGEGHRHQQGPADGEGIGVGHRTEQCTFGPVIENSGMNAQTMIVVEKNRRPLDLGRRVDDPVDQRPRPVGVGRRDVPVDVLDDDRGAVDDDAEIDRADRQQVGRLALHVQHRDREQQAPAGS